MDTEFIQNTDQKSNTAPYPIVYCDENLNVADVSPTAKAGNFAHLQGLSLKKHLSAKDISALTAYLKSLPNSDNRGIFVDINNVKGTKCAHVTAVKLFGKSFFEMRLFPWDMTAGEVIVEEAGGVIEYLHEKELPFDRPAGILVANSKENFGKLREIVYRAIPEKLY